MHAVLGQYGREGVSWIELDEASIDVETGRSVATGPPPPVSAPSPSASSGFTQMLPPLLPPPARKKEWGSFALGSYLAHTFAVNCRQSGSEDTGLIEAPSTPGADRAGAYRDRAADKADERGAVQRQGQAGDERLPGAYSAAESFRPAAPFGGEGSGHGRPDGAPAADRAGASRDRAADKADERGAVQRQGQAGDERLPGAYSAAESFRPAAPFGGEGSGHGRPDGAPAADRAVAPPEGEAGGDAGTSVGGVLGGGMAARGRAGVRGGTGSRFKRFRRDAHDQ
ncbi:collagen alpha-2(I) chain-like [Paramacrobiotus metropolitanus]|uniref:collagen alpha-2(I) chain-like n=1 Tax=Paramacrobiotus metropolitanus TaxID=2943436 RepID=UPI0024457D0F|nr:collagen alpha-2(I) chain-like [Paramacrobiotus metropolitanus]